MIAPDFLSIDGSGATLLIVVTVFCCVVGSFFWCLCDESRQRSPIPTLQMPPGCHWLLGHLVCIDGDFQSFFLKFLTHWANEYGQTAFWMISTPYISVTDWRDARAILNAEYSRSRIPLLKWHMSMFLGSRNLAILNGREWKHHRSAVMKSLGRNALEKLRQDVTETTLTLVNSLKQRLRVVDSTSVEKAIEMKVEELMKMVTVDTIVKSELSKDLRCCANLRHSDIAASFECLATEFTRRLDGPSFLANFLYFLPTKENRESHRARATLRSFIAGVIRERREESNECYNDMLSNILIANESAKRKLQQDDKISDQTLEDVLISLLFAGYDTTSITLTYALYFLSQYPDVEKNCLEEIHSVGVERPTDLIYCKSVIIETLRLYGPAYATIRTLENPITLRGDLVVPAGINVLIPLYILHRDEVPFPRATEFYPDRWTKKDGTGQYWVDRGECDETIEAGVEGDDSKSSSSIPPGNRKAMLAFSAGPRSCPGYKFAMEEALIAFAILLKELKFRTVEDYQLRPQFTGLIQHPKDGMTMKISIRENGNAPIR